MDNANSTEYLEKIKKQVIENLQRTTFAPSVQMTDVPRNDLAGGDDLGEQEAELDDYDADENRDVRIPRRQWDKIINDDRELSDTEDDINAAERYAGVRQPHQRRRPRIMDYQNPHAVPDNIPDSGMASGIGTPEPAANSSQNGDADMNENGLSTLAAAASPITAAASFDTTNTLSIPADARGVASPSAQSQRGSPVPPPSAATASAPANEDPVAEGDEDVTMDDGLAEETTEAINAPAASEPLPGETANDDAGVANRTPPASPPAPAAAEAAAAEIQSEDVDMADVDAPTLPPTQPNPESLSTHDPASSTSLDPTAPTTTGDPIIGVTEEPRAMTGASEHATAISAAVAAAREDGSTAEESNEAAAKAEGEIDHEMGEAAAERAMHAEGSRTEANPEEGAAGGTQ